MLIMVLQAISFPYIRVILGGIEGLPTFIKGALPYKDSGGVWGTINSGIEGILYIHITASRELVSGNIPYYDAFEKTSFGGLTYITVKRETAGGPIKIATTGPIYSGGSFLFMVV